MFSHRVFCGTHRERPAAALLCLALIPCLSAVDVPLPTETSVDPGFVGARDVAAVDVDGDGDLDLLGAAFGDDDAVWFENTAGDATAWTTNLIDFDFNGAISIFPVDMDRDGDPDVLACSEFDDEVVWWENMDGLGTFTPLASSEVIIASALGAPQSVYAGDIDGDGDPDVVTATFASDGVIWFENTAGDGSAWTPTLIAGGVDEASSVVLADMDGDGDLDVLGTSRALNAIAWFENLDGAGTFTPLGSAHPVTLSFTNVFDAIAADVDGDGDLDVVGAAFDDAEVAWFENTNGIGTAWSSANTLSASFAGTTQVAAADLDCDGDTDILGAAVTDGEITCDHAAANERKRPVCLPRCAANGRRVRPRLQPRRRPSGRCGADDVPPCAGQGVHPDRGRSGRRTRARRGGRAA